MTKTLNQAIVLMVRRTANIAQLSQKFFAKNKAKYHVIGLTRLWTDVYWKFPESEYERTHALLNSFKTELITDGMKLFLDETGAIAAVKPGMFQYYPSYVSEGIFSRPPKHPGARNIPTGWKEALQEKVTEDFAREVSRSVVRLK